MQKALLTLLLLSVPALCIAQECVILLHGLARTAGSMATLEKVLEDAGYKVVNEGYASTTDTVENLAEASIPQALAACDESAKVNFVTHSMGGILVRYYLSQHAVESLGRVVMLGPPNKGSQVVDELGNVPGFEFINGPAGLQLGTGKSSLPNTLGSADFDVGIVAGSRSINLLLSTQLPNPDDGKVSVENTKLEGMNDHIVMPVTHTFMMRNDEVIQQVLHYLKNGAFAHR